jgi:hypothetical protein
MRLAPRTREALAFSAGMIDTGQAAFGGLAHAVGLGDMLHRGRHARPGGHN